MPARPRTGHGAAREDIRDVSRGGATQAFQDNRWYRCELGREQPGTWVTVLTGDMGNTFPVLFRSVAVVPVDPVGNAQRCPQVHRRHDVWVCAGGPRNGR